MRPALTGIGDLDIVLFMFIVGCCTTTRPAEQRPTAEEFARQLDALLPTASPN